MTVRFTARGADQLDALAARFEREAARLPGQLEGVVRGEQPDVLARLRAAWMGIDVQSSRGGGSSSGLRARVAAATRAEPIPGGVRYWVDGAAVDPGYGRSLTWYLDGFGRWRHPVYGHEDRWTQQTGQEVFFATLAAVAPRVENDINRVIDEVARRIEG